MPKNVVSAYSSAILALTEALDCYPISPELGLTKAKQTLFHLSQQLLSDDATDCVYQRTHLAASSLDNIIKIQPIYDHLLSVALHEILDGLEQYALANELGDAYLHLILPWFEGPRFCWRLLAQKKELTRQLPILPYEARLTALESSDIMPLMTRLGEISEVSFHLDGEAGKSTKGYFKVLTVQPLAWLKQSFPMLVWQQIMVCHDAFDVDFFASSYALAFLSTELPRRERRRILDSMSERIKADYYIKFSECFSTPYKEEAIKQGECLVPGALNNMTTTLLREQIARPIRIAGYYYQEITQDKVADQASVLSSDSSVQYSCLGRDVLSSWLYIVDAGQQHLAFAQTDCLGSFPFQSMQLYPLESGRWECRFDVGLNAELEMKSELFYLLDGVLQSASGAPFELFVIRQNGRNIAIAINSFCSQEGICSYSIQAGTRIKNIWLNEQGKRFIEPWLMPEGLPSAVSVDIKTQPVKTSSVKQTGYYQAMFAGGTLWVAASLVIDLVSTVSASSFCVFAAGESEQEKGLLYGMEHFSRLVSLHSEKKQRFALLLDGLSIGFLSESFVWCDCLPDALPLGGMDSLSLVADQHGGWRLASKAHLGCDLVINTHNIANFIHYLWPQHSSGKCE